MPDSDSLVTEKELARTYDGGDYDDAWTAVDQYRRAITYHTDNPEAGIGEIVRISGATRTTVQSWIDDGGTPVVVQALYTAHKNDIIGVSYDEITPLNVLVAHAISGGTIKSHDYQPMFTVSSLENSMVVNSLEFLGFGSKEYDNGPDASNPAVVPATNAALLGRVLAVLGVPVGNKTDYDDLSLPSYLEDAPASVRKRFVDIYLRNRAQPYSDTAGLAIKEQRPQSYREELAALIESVAGERVRTTASGVMVSADAARALGYDQSDDELPESEPVVDSKALARTYDGGNYDDPWDAVVDYREVMEYANNHPEDGPQAIASAVGLPRSRIRPWLDGGAPDAVRAIETARDYGWLAASYGDPAFTALNTLVANTFSGGSIAEQHYQPSFSINHLGEDSHIFDALELAGVSYQVVGDRDGQADEVRPSEDGAVLGRVLAVIGAPVGPKTDQHLSLPPYLDAAPGEVREQFVYAYLENRATEHKGKATLTLREDRNRDYLEELAELIDDVAGGGVRLSERDIVVSADAARSLGTVR